MGKLTYTTAQVQYLLDEVAKINAAVIIDNGEVASLEFKNDTKLQYNYVLDTLEIEYANGTTLQIGREQTTFVYNNTGSAIPNGTPVYYSGVGGDVVTVPLIAPADATNLATAMVKGHSTIDIPNGSYGIIVCKGEMTVPSHGLATGNKIYLNIGGGYTTTPPSTPNLTIELGIVLDEDTLHVYPCIISPFLNSSTSLTSVLFLSNVNSGISTFKNLSKTLDVAETTKTITATNNTVAGEKYISEQLGITYIPAAVFAAHSICKVSSTLGTSKIRFDVSLYHADTSTTLLFSGESGDLNFTVDTSLEFTIPFTAITCVETDRLLIEAYFSATHTNPVTFTYYVGDGRATHVEIPLPISHTDLSNLNTDSNFLHVTNSQITGWDDKVDGPASSVNNTVPVFDGVTGKLLKGSEITVVNDNILTAYTLASSQGSTLGSALTIPLTNNVETKPTLFYSGSKQFEMLMYPSTTHGVASYWAFVLQNSFSVKKEILRLNSTYTVGGQQVNSINVKSQLFVDESVGIGTSSPIANSMLDISSGNIAITLGADENLTTRTNNASKIARIGAAHYTNAEEPLGLIRGFSNATEGIVNIGGGTSSFNAATQVSIFTATNNTTVTGTERIRIDNVGNMLYTSQNFEIKATASANRLRLIGGTSGSVDDGAYINVQGKDYGGTNLGGYIQYLAGNQAGASHLFYTGNTQERMRINSSGQVGIGTITPVTNSLLDISSGNISINIGADVSLLTRTNNTAKTGRITSMHYANAEEPLALIQGFSDASTNIVNIGGGTSAANTATGVVIYAAANTTTLTGTEIARFNTTGLGIGTSTPGAKLDVSNGSIALLIGADSTLDTRTNNTLKYGRIGSAHYANAEEPLGVIFATSNSANNIINIGGGTSSFNAATQIIFNTAANNTTTVGSERMRIASDGNVGIGTNNPSEKLHVIGNILSSGTITAASVNKVTEVHSANLQTFHTTVEINPNTLNEEVTLFTIPDGYRGFLIQSSIVPAACTVGINNYSTATASTAAVLTFYWTPIDSGSEASSNETLNTISSVTGKSLSPYIKPNTTIRCKVTTAGVGYSNKVVLQANLILQPV